MTPQWQREAIVLLATAATIARAVYPKPIIDGAARQPYKSPLKARLLFVFGAILMFWVWYGIYSGSR
jgi:hypothetical protein